MPTTAETGRLGTEALALRDACVAALAVIGVTPDAYLYPGNPPIDIGEPPCDGMLAVFVPNIGRLPINLSGGPLGGQTKQPIARVPSITYTVVFATCVDVWGDDTGNAPDPAALTSQTLDLLTIGWTLMNGVHHAVVNGTLFDRCLTYTLGDLTPLSVQGNSAGWSFDASAQMDGFDPYV